MNKVAIRGLNGTLLGVLCVLLTFAQSGSAEDSFVGFQTFSNCGANNNSGVCGTNAQSNSTYDSSPVGSIGPGDLYLTAALGVDASSVGRKGRGQNQNNGFLNGAGFGNESGDSGRLIVNITLSDGSPGERIGAFGTSPQGAPNGTSSWKFSTSVNERTGDIRVTNHSDYYFRLQFINFDARVGNANAPTNLEIKYLAGDGTAFDNALTRKDTGAELVDLNNVYNNDFGAGPVVSNVSLSLGGVTGTQVYLPPGQSAGFRFVWTASATNGAESQLDNIAFQGQFFETAALAVEVNPAAVTPVPGLGGALAWLLSSILLGFGMLKARQLR